MKENIENKYKINQRRIESIVEGYSLIKYNTKIAFSPCGACDLFIDNTCSLYITIPNPESRLCTKDNMVEYFFKLNISKIFKTL